MKDMTLSKNNVPPVSAVNVRTVHYAHVCITAKSDKEYGNDCVDDVDKIVKSVLSKYDNKLVEVDDLFCCHVLSEVGLRGCCLDSVTKAALEIADAAEKHPKLKLFEY